MKIEKVTSQNTGDEFTFIEVSESEAWALARSLLDQLETGLANRREFFKLDGGGMATIFIPPPGYHDTEEGEGPIKTSDCGGVYWVCAGCGVEIGPTAGVCKACGYTTASYKYECRKLRYEEK